MTQHFKPKRIPGFSRRLVIRTSRKKYLDPKQTKATIHCFRGATLEDLTRTLQQYRPKKLHTVKLIAGFNDHDASANDFSNNCRKLINNQFHPKLSSLKLISSFIQPLKLCPHTSISIIIISVKMVYIFYSNQVFACYLTRMFEFFTRWLIMCIHTTNSLPYLDIVHMFKRSQRWRGLISYMRNLSAQ